MGNFCYCIPLRVYALSVGCFQFILCLYLYIQFCLGPLIVTNLYVIVNYIGIIFTGTLVIAGGFLTFGILLRRNEYISVYLILNIFSIAFLVIGVLVTTFTIPVWPQVYLEVLIVTGVLTFPIYLLHVEMNDGKITGVTV